jgi:hypothetical protein
LIVAASLSGPLYVPEVQEARPEVASVPLQRIVTGWLYQPLKSGARERCAVTPVGGVASILRRRVTAVARPSEFCAQQLSVVPPVGPGTVTAAKQLVEVALSDTDQWTTTLSPWVLPRYQPFVPAIPSIE